MQMLNSVWAKSSSVKALTYLGALYCAAKVSEFAVRNYWRVTPPVASLQLL